MEYILKEMKARIIENVLEAFENILILINVSPSIGNKSMLTVYLKCDIEKEIPLYFSFWHIIEFQIKNQILRMTAY